MKRLFWLGVGLAVGGLVVRVVTRKAQSYTPRGIAAATVDSGRNLLDAAREFVEDVRDGMHEREQELHAAFAAGELAPDEFTPDEPSFADPASSESAGAGGRRAASGDRADGRWRAARAEDGDR